MSAHSERNDSNESLQCNLNLAHPDVVSRKPNTSISGTMMASSKSLRVMLMSLLVELEAFIKKSLRGFYVPESMIEATGANVVSKSNGEWR